jgi:hypothetical protein
MRVLHIILEVMALQFVMDINEHMNMIIKPMHCGKVQFIRFETFTTTECMKSSWAISRVSSLWSYNPAFRKLSLPPSSGFMM